MGRKNQTTSSPQWCVCVCAHARARKNIRFHASTTTPFARELARLCVSDRRQPIVINAPRGIRGLRCRRNNCAHTHGAAAQQGLGFVEGVMQQIVLTGTNNYTTLRACVIFVLCSCVCEQCRRQRDHSCWGGGRQRGMGCAVVPLEMSLCAALSPMREAATRR